MIEIRFPDQSLRSYTEGTTPFEIAQGISEGLARNVLSAKFNDQVVEASTPLFEDGKIQLFTWKDDQGKNAFWHSSAHVLAQSILVLYPNAKLTIGPAIENGFYYDVDFGAHSITEKELKDIEKKFLEFARQKFEFKMRSVSKKEALDFYKKDENPL
jgi:threonyl-tRNA synthetase